MMLHDNTYSAFMLDYAAGALSQAEHLVADVHCALSAEGRSNAWLMDAIGGVLLERGDAAKAIFRTPPGLTQSAADTPPPSGLSRYLEDDLLALPWRRSLFGVQTLPADMPMASLLRLDPGDRAPSHGHGRRDVTVVLRGAFADEFGVYERGDLAFAEPGLKHTPRAVGDEPCVCLVATEPGRPLRGLLGLFGWVGAKQREAA